MFDLAGGVSPVVVVGVLGLVKKAHRRELVYMVGYYDPLYALAELDVPEALSGGPQTAADLAPVVGAALFLRFAVMHSS